jgi:hypothetical protein
MTNITNRTDSENRYVKSQIVAGGTRDPPHEAPHRSTPGRVASSAGIKPGEAVPLRQDRCRWCDRPRGPRCRHGGERRRDQAGRARRSTSPRAARCADVSRPSTCPAAAPGSRPASLARRSTESRSMPATCRAARRAPPRPVLAGADRWGVLGSRISITDHNPRSQ